MGDLRKWVWSEVPDDDQIFVIGIALPYDEPIVGAPADLDSPQALTEGAAPRECTSWVGLEEVDRVVDCVEQVLHGPFLQGRVGE
jgi:hypothetical protein